MLRGISIGRPPQGQLGNSEIRAHHYRQNQWGDSANRRVGLEIDKMSRAALDRYWATYPALLFDMARESGAQSFKRLEIDSYEAGPQTWTTDMPKEFQQRRGYSLIKWLPVLAGKTIVSRQASDRMKHDWAMTISDLFCDYYYGYMGEAARRQGMEAHHRVLWQPGQYL